MKRYLLLFLMLILVDIITFPQIKNQNTNSEISPYKTAKVNQVQGPRTIWDVELSFDVTAASGAAGNAGAEFDGTYFYTTRWATNLIHKYDMSGNLVEQFSIPGVSGLRDLAFDGTYFYGGAASNTIYRMDFNSKTLIGTITSPVSVRFIAYDGTNDAFWCGNWNTDPTLVSRNGAILASFSTGLSSQYGAAYQPYTSGLGGPFLWIFDEGSGAGLPQIISQWDIASGTATGVTHDVMTDVGIGNTSAIAGGLFSTADFVGGKFSLGGLLQGVPDMFFVYELYDTGPHPGPGPAANPVPANGATDVDINQDLSWENPSGAASMELLFGTNLGSLTSVYSGSPISTFNPGTMDYLTTYYWRVNETDSSGTTIGTLWNFTTLDNPFSPPKFYPQSIDYWTGTTDGYIKTDVSEVRTIDPEVGWMVFDISDIQPGSYVYSIEFWGYVNSTNWPYWSATPMGSVNPVTDDPASISNQIMANYDQGIAYIFSNEAGSYTTGWHNYMLEANAVPDLQTAVDAGQGWFAIGFVDRDFSPSYYLNFDGWAQTFKPYIEIGYYGGYYPPNAPSNLNAICTQPHHVDLTWQDNSNNEMGFEVKRKLGDSSSTNQWDYSVNVPMNTISFTDTTVLDTTIYSYAVRAYNPDGYSLLSNIATVTTIIPVELISFNADCSDGKVLLSWATSTETNNKGFEVQRSDGQSIRTPSEKSEVGGQTSGWTVIGFVEGNGTTTKQHSYSFADSKIQSGRYQYRLKQIDFNGSFACSPVVEVDADFPEEFSLSRNYPNPFNPATKIRYQLPADNLVTIKVYNALGEEIATLVNEFKPAGSYETEFSGSRLPTGIYIYKMVSGSYSSVRKMLLLK